MSNSRYRENTKLLHSGYKAGSTGSRAVPIYQTTSYLFDNTDHAAKLFDLKTEGYIYTRIGNPTLDVLEKRISDFENGISALALASGQSASMIALLNIAQAGDEIVAGNNLYGGSHNLFRHTFKRMGIHVHFAESSDIESYGRLVNERTKAIYAETIGNPKLDVLDIESLASLAHRKGIPLIVDNTAMPYQLHPFDFGADIIVYSATKFLGGHGNSVAGIIVDSGRFDWGNGKFPLIAENDHSYHGKNFLKEFGNLAYILKARVSLLRDMGPALSPLNAFLILQGMETLHLRMPRHCENAGRVAEFLSDHPRIERVSYPGLQTSPYYELARKYMPEGAGAIIGIEISGGYESARQFIDKLRLISHVANIGDTRTLVIHPASTTQQQMTDEEKNSQGVAEGFIRLSIGLEDADDIIEDIQQALE